MTEERENQVSDMLSHLNKIYGKGDVHEVNFRKRKFVYRIRFSQQMWGDRHPLSFRYRFRKNKVTVFALRHQITAKLKP